MILEQARASEGIQDRIEMVMEEEFREREARRLNLVIHGMTSQMTASRTQEKEWRETRRNVRKSSSL